MSEARFVHALALGLDPAWRRLPAAERCETAQELAEAVSLASDVITHTYSMVGLTAGADLLLWSLGPTLDSLEQRAAFEEKLSILRRLILGLDIAVLAVVGYWIGNAVGGMRG